MAKHTSILYLLIITLIAIIVTEKMGIILSVKRENLSCQPLDIDYKQGYPFCLDVKEEQSLLHTKKSIILSSTDNTLEDTLCIEDKKALTSKNIEWQEDGVFIKREDGNQLFIPKENFPKAIKATVS